MAAFDSEKMLAMADKYGTPLYLYDFEIIIKKIEKLKETFPDTFNIFYSMKCNPNLGLLNRIKDHVDGVEVASAGELFLAMESGIESSRIIFVGPGKTMEELMYAIENNILCIVAESPEEIENINYLSNIQNKISKIAIRINPKIELSGARIKMGGTSKQFGIDEEKIDVVIKSLKNMQNISFEGIHVYMGTQVLQEELIKDSIKNILNIAKSICSKHGIKLKLIDFGGGFGVPYFLGELPLDMERLKKELNEIFDDDNLNDLHKDVKLIIESGRYLVAEAGTYLTKVLYKKESRGKIYIVTDGGSNHHSSAAGIGRFIRNNFPVTLLNNPSNNTKQTVDIVGTLCTPTDTLASNIELPEIKIGNIVAIEKSGAYGFSASPLGFISHQSPAEILLIDGEEYIVRKRGTIQDLLYGQCIQ